MKVFDITKKCHNLTCMDNMKTCTIVPFNILSRLDEKEFQNN